MGGITMYLATTDASFAVVPNYDDQGAQVDEQLAVQARAQQLGWTVRPVSRAVEVGKHQSLRVRLLDAQGQALEGVTADFVAFANARAARRQAGSWRPDPAETGVYLVDLDMQRAGHWELQFRMQQGQVSNEIKMRTKLVELPR